MGRRLRECSGRFGPIFEAVRSGRQRIGTSGDPSLVSAHWVCELEGKINHTLDDVRVSWYPAAPFDVTASSAGALGHSHLG